MKSFCSLALMGVLTGCAAWPLTGRLPVDGATLAYAQEAGPTPTIVFQSGLGNDRTTWKGLVQDLRGRQATFAFDRPGYGDSTAVPAGSRDPCHIADETRELLRAAGVKPPYVLVGHSLGGLYQYVYARRHPEDVAALVLLDPTHPKHWETMQREVPPTTGVMKGMRALFSTAARAEFDDHAACLDQIDHDRPLGIPTQVLVSTRFSLLERSDFQSKVLWPLREDWLRLTGARQLTKVDAGHYIHVDAPNAVMQALQVAAQPSP